MLLHFFYKYNGTQNACWRELGPTRTNVVFHVMFRFLPLTLLSPVGASGSVIHDPNLDPEVLMVTGSEIPVNFPQADTHTWFIRFNPFVNRLMTFFTR